MNRGEVWWVDFSGNVGGEANKVRPAIIVSNDRNNVTMNRVQVVPLTRNVRRVFDWDALVAVNGQPSKAQANQIATVSKVRIRDRLAVLSAEDMRNVDRALRVQLGLT